jgi:hypothetical protein
MHVFSMWIVWFLLKWLWYAIQSYKDNVPIMSEEITMIIRSYKSKDRLCNVQMKKDCMSWYWCDYYYCAIRVAQLFVFCVVFFVCSFSFGHCVTSSSIYGFWLSLWHYLVFQSFESERTWWWLLQKSAVHTTFDMYVFIWNWKSKAKIYSIGRRTLVLLIIILFRNCIFQ